MIAYLGEVEYRKGHLREATHFTGLAVDNARDNERYWDYPVVHALAAYPHAALANWDQADYHAAESAAIAQLTGAPAFLAYAAAARAAIAQARDDAAGLLKAADIIEASYDSREPGTHLLGPVRADALARLGRPAEAAESLRRLAEGPGAKARKSARLSATRVTAAHALSLLGQRAAAERALRAARQEFAAMGRPPTSNSRNGTPAMGHAPR